MKRKESGVKRLLQRRYRKLRKQVIENVKQSEVARSSPSYEFSSYQ